MSKINMYLYCLLFCATIVASEDSKKSQIPVLQVYRSKEERKDIKHQPERLNSITINGTTIITRAEFPGVVAIIRNGVFGKR